jgi:hypothetical protein
MELLVAPLDRGPRQDGPVANYKRLLQQVLDSRPSGMRQRLAEALGKNRSFISQISNPSYSTPIPPQHIERIFEICHFSAQERERFLAAYHEAHPRHRPESTRAAASRKVSIAVPDLGDAQRNRELDRLMTEIAGKIARLVRGT